MAKKTLSFTLLELVVAMGVFAVLMLALMQFFSSAQKLWTVSSNRTEVFENARIAMNMIATDLQNAYYENGHDPSKKLFIYPVDTNPTSARLAFATVRAYIPNEYCRSKLCKVQYKLASGTLYINIVGDYTSDGSVSNTKKADSWPFMAGASSATNFITTPLSDDTYNVSSPADYKDGWKELIPYVTSFTYQLYDKSDTELIAIPTGKTTFPYKVIFSITVVDKVSYLKWQQAGSPTSGDIYTNLITNHSRTFTRMVLIDRSQYP